jgi:thiol-disulfide isomerase/thioredoxin
METRLINRRAILSGAAGFAISGAVRADDNASPVAHGILANNPLAKAFEPVNAKLPDVALNGPNGSRSISEFKGRALLMPLWAEWCAPCLSELQDFATLQKKYANDKFAIVPILSGTQKRMTPATVAKLFSYLHADALEPLVESRFGEVLLSAMARGEGHEIVVPCNVLIAPDGRVVGREIGMKTASDYDADSKHQMLAQAEAGRVLSEWGKPAGAEFAAAMANGFLS